MMQVNQRKSLIPVLVVVLAPIACPQSQPPVPSVLTGRLVTGKANTPVPNAMVQYSIAGVPTGVSNTGTTDANGLFGFEIPLAAPAQVQLSITTNLYNFMQMTVPLNPGANPQLTIPLVHKTSGQFGGVSGSVHAGGQPIPNATVSIVNAGDFLTTTTNSNGQYQITKVGFSSNLILQVSTATPPCIATMQLGLDMNTTHVVLPVAATRVLTKSPICPPPQTSPAGGVPAAVRPSIGIDDTVQWEQADALSISNSGAPNAWNAGRVQDILRFPPGKGILVASDEGGVWSIAETAARTATPLSNEWTSVSMSSLALGTGGPQDVYAATFSYGDSEGGDLWETDTSQTAPLQSWDLVKPKPPCGTINKVLVIPEGNLILLACDTGVYSSSIPPAPSVLGTYTWTQALPTPYGSQPFSDLAEGPGWSFAGTRGSIVATTFAGFSGRVVFTGAFKGSKLVLTPVTGTWPSSPGRSSVAACASNPANMYAVFSIFTGPVIFETTNGGFNWNAVSVPPSAGTNGDSNQAVAVSPDCSTVAVGWQTGTFVSFNQGASWTPLTDVGEYNNLHSDITALTFDSNLPATLWIGSAGGVVEAMGVTSGSPPTYDSTWNQELFNLEFFQGAPSASVTGLVSGATQDNGVLYSVLAGVWQHVIDCPGLVDCWGNLAFFARPFDIGTGNDMLLAQNWFNPAATAGAQGIQSTNGSIPFDGGAPIPINIPCSPCTPYMLNMAAPVRSPGGYVNSSGQNMYAVAELNVCFDNPCGSAGSAPGIYGLFTNVDGSSMHWELLNAGLVPNNTAHIIEYLWGDTTAIAPTYDGGSIFVGVGAQIYRLDAPYTGAPIELTVNAPASCGCIVTGLYAFNFIQNDENPLLTPPSLAYATYGPHFMAYYGLSWDEFGAGDLPHDRSFLSIVATDSTRIYIASSAGVFDSTNGGANWENASIGLPTLIPGEAANAIPSSYYPVFPGLTHDYLQLVADPPPISDTRLYLASYGRSVWRTYFPLPAPPAQRAFQNITIEMTTGNDNLESYSELQATLYTIPPQYICLKPSTTTQPSPGGVCNNGPTAMDRDGNQTWNNGQSVSQNFTLGVPVVLDAASIVINLYQHYTFPEQTDFWDLQEIQVSGTDGSGSLGVLSMTNGPVSGNNCMARLGESPQASGVVYGLSANNPAGYNIEYPVVPFGATPPGSCPQ